MDMNKVIGLNIQERRKELGLSLMDVAVKANMDKSSVYRYEHGEFANMNISTLENLAKALHTNVSLLMGNDNLRTDEKILLNLYNSFSKQGKEVVFEHLDLLSYKFCDKLAAHKKSNISSDTKEIQEDIDLIK